MDIKAKVEEIVKKLKADPKLLSEFQSKPIPTLEKLLGVDLPDEQLGKVVEMVKAKIDLDKAASLLGGFLKK